MKADQSVSRSRKFPFIVALSPAGYFSTNEDYLWQQGILGLETVNEDGNLEMHRIYFEDGLQRNACVEMMRSLMSQVVVLNDGWVDYKDWESFLHGGFEPLQSGPLFVIPEFNPPPVPPGLTPLQITPGRGFGTGSHPTTHLCLDYLTAQSLAGETMLDLGTGSGILSIAACLMGAAHVDAVDIDADALENARENAELNGCGEAITFLRGSLEKVAGRRYPIVCANIISHVLRLLLEQGLVRVVQPGGLLIVSGILPEEIDAMASEFTEAGLQVIGRRIMGEWSSLLLRRDAGQ